MADVLPRRRALVVEDDAGIRELLRLHLDLAGFTLDESGDGRLALERARSAAFDLILLDVMLPGLDGVSVCRAIRNGGPNVNTPILMITARDGESDKVLGLESGADDYLTKPFGMRELMARIGALLRRHLRQTAEEAPQTVVNAGDLSLDCDRRQATVRGERIELTKQEFDQTSRTRAAPRERCRRVVPRSAPCRSGIATHRGAARSSERRPTEPRPRPPSHWDYRGRRRRSSVRSPP